MKNSKLDHVSQMNESAGSPAESTFLPGHRDSDISKRSHPHMSTEDTNDKTTPMSGPAEAAPAEQQNTVSPRKREANRKNAQLSTGPKTAEGKAKSAQNAVTHGIFVKQYVSGATPETVEEMKKLAAGFWEHYRPVGMIEEMLVEKLCIETVRYSRVLRLEIDELARKHAFFGPGVDRVGRYGTNVNRALYRVMEELGRLQAVRKASEKAAAAPDEESADLTAETERGNPGTGDFLAGRNY